MTMTTTTSKELLHLQIRDYFLWLFASKGKGKRVLEAMEEEFPNLTDGTTLDLTQVPYLLKASRHYGYEWEKNLPSTVRTQIEDGHSVSRKRKGEDLGNQGPTKRASADIPEANSSWKTTTTTTKPITVTASSINSAAASLTKPTSHPGSGNSTTGTQQQQQQQSFNASNPVVLANGRPGAVAWRNPPWRNPPWRNPQGANVTTTTTVVPPKARLETNGQPSTNSSTHMPNTMQAIQQNIQFSQQLMQQNMALQAQYSRNPMTAGAAAAAAAMAAAAAAAGRQGFMPPPNGPSSWPNFAGRPGGGGMTPYNNQSTTPQAMWNGMNGPHSHPVRK